jgi:TyrR family helix-turn-helix protein
MLEAYQWPGNVRELRNMVENMIVSIPAEIIEAHHLPFHTYNEGGNCHSLTLKTKVEQFEQRLVKETIQHYSSLRQAAKELGIDHSTLIKKLKRWECKEREEQP